MLWLLFGGFTLVNGLLAFFPLPLAWRAALGSVELAFSLAMVLGWAGLSFPKQLWEEELVSFPPTWILFLLLLTTAYLRFTHLTTLSQWPLTDEAKSGYFAMQLATQGWGSARLLYDFSQLPPLYTWMEGVFFKVFGVSLFSLWCLPALLSLLTVPAFYLAARAFFSRSFALILAGLMAFGFWPLYAGRFSHPGVLLLLWECLAVWLAGKLKTKNSHRAFAVIPPGFYLGLWTGAGFYTFTSWPGAALALALWVFFFHRRALTAFLGGMILVYLPLGVAGFQNSYGGYIRHVWGFHSGEAWVPQILRCFWDFCAFFWESPVPENLFAYKPFWGGYLNPLWGACFFLGTIVFSRMASAPWVKFGSLAFILLYLPGFLTGGVEMFRVIPILPLLLAGAALGLSALLSGLKRTWRWPALGLFFLLSLGMDGYHLFGVYQNVWAHPKDNWFGSKSLDRLRAYGLLEDWRKKWGPGLILCDLVPDLYDQSLPLATFSFNAVENPGLDPAQARWAAVFTNVNYRDCLEKRFPQAQWAWLAPDMGWSDGGGMLAFIPLPCPSTEALGRLVAADQAMRELVPAVFDNRDYRSRQPVMEKLASLYPLFENDPYLESCFWEKIADNAYGDGNYDAQMAALRQAVEKGCPAAHLYNDLGALYFRRSRFKEARQNFKEALICPGAHTSAAAGLEMLDEAEKTGQLPKD